MPSIQQQHGQSGKFGKFLHLSEHTTRTLGCASFALQPAFSQLHSPNTHVYLLHQNFTPFNQFDETLSQNFNLTNFGSLLYHYPISLPHAQEKHTIFPLLNAGKSPKNFLLLRRRRRGFSHLFLTNITPPPDVPRKHHPPQLHSF